MIVSTSFEIHNLLPTFQWTLWNLCSWKSVVKI